MFTKPKYTNSGKELQARALSGACKIIFTSVGLGAGELTTQAIAALTDLIQPVKRIDIQTIDKISTDTVQMKAVLRNIELTTGFFWREFGLYAQDPDNPDDRTKDILFCYQNAGDLAEYIPTASEQLLNRVIYLGVTTGDADRVEINFNEKIFCLQEDFIEHCADPSAHDNLAHYTDPEAHSDLFAGVVHLTGNETIEGIKTFKSTISGNITGNASTATKATTADTATRATQDSDGKQINTTYSKVGHTHDDRYYTESEVNNLLNGKSDTSHTHSYNNLTDRPTIPTVPTNISAFNNDVGYLKDSDITYYKFRCPGGWWNYVGYEGTNAYDNISINGAGDTIGNNSWGLRPVDGWGQLISFSSDNSKLSNTLHLWWGFNHRKLLFRTYYNGGWASWDELLTGSMGTFEIGSTVLATTNIALSYGQTTAGSNLKYAGLDLDGGVLDLNNNIGATGTWIKVSGNSGNNNGFGLYRRIA